MPRTRTHVRERTFEEEGRRLRAMFEHIISDVPLGVMPPDDTCLRVDQWRIVWTQPRIVKVPVYLPPLRVQ